MYRKLLMLLLAAFLFGGCAHQPKNTSNKLMTGIEANLQKVYTRDEIAKMYSDNGVRLEDFERMARRLVLLGYEVVSEKGIKFRGHGVMAHYTLKDGTEGDVKIYFLRRKKFLGLFVSVQDITTGDDILFTDVDEDGLPELVTINDKNYNFKLDRDLVPYLNAVRSLLQIKIDYSTEEAG